MDAPAQGTRLARKTKSKTVSKNIQPNKVEKSENLNSVIPVTVVNAAETDASNGLSLAVSSVSEIDAEQRLVIVAVRSNAASNLRLVPGTPELQIQTGDDKGNALQTERLERIYVETTSLEGLILPGSTVYYALVYNAPVMGASQRLRVLVSHREAADTPTSVLLPNVNAVKEFVGKVRRCRLNRLIASKQTRRLKNSVFSDLSNSRL